MIDKSFILSFSGMYPVTGDIILRSKTSYSTSGDGFASNVTFSNSRKFEPRVWWLQQANLMGSGESCEWHLWHQGQAILPKAEDVLLDEDGVSWKVVDVRRELMEALYACLCQRMGA